VLGAHRQPAVVHEHGEDGEVVAGADDVRVVGARHVAAGGRPGAASRAAGVGAPEDASRPGQPLPSLEAGLWTTARSPDCHQPS